MNRGLSRRGVVAAHAAAFAAKPVHVAIAASRDKIALARWAERQAAVERLRGLSAAYSAAAAKRPAWAAAGLDRIDQDGNPCGDLVSWPLDTRISSPVRRLVSSFTIRASILRAVIENSGGWRSIPQSRRSHGAELQCAGRPDRLL